MADRQERCFSKPLSIASRFPWKLYHIVSNCKSGSIEWSDNGITVSIRPGQFKKEYLDPPDSVFKTAIFGSFVRQLNLYGFHKVQASRMIPIENLSLPEGPVIYKFRNKLFVHGRPDLVSKIHRNIGARKSKENCVIGNYEIDQKRNLILRDFAFNGCPIAPQPLMVVQTVQHIYRPLCSVVTTSPGHPVAILPTNQIIPFGSNLPTGYISQKQFVKDQKCEETYETFFEEEEMQLKTLKEYEEDSGEKEVTVMKKKDFENLVSTFTEMLREDPEALVASLAEIDEDLGSFAQDLLQKSNIIGEFRRELESVPFAEGQKKTIFLPDYCDSFPFSARASHPDFNFINDHFPTMQDNNLYDFAGNEIPSFPLEFIDFEQYKKNLSYI